jgi:hypothetical protein
LYYCGLTCLVCLVFKQLICFFSRIKYKVVHILAYLPRFDTAIRQNGKSGRVSVNSMAHFQAEV